MKTPLAARELERIIAARGWTQGDLAVKAKLARSVISWHLSRHRAIRDEHLGAYLHAFETPDRQTFIAAWLRDVVRPGATLAKLLGGDGLIVRDVSNWQPSLTADQQSLLSWCAERLQADDRDFATALHMIRQLATRIHV